MDSSQVRKSTSLPVGHCVQFISASRQSDSEMKLKTALRETEGPSVQRLWGATFSMVNIVPPRDSPHWLKPPSDIISLVGKATTFASSAVLKVSQKALTWPFCFMALKPTTKESASFMRRCSSYLMSVLKDSPKEHRADFNSGWVTKNLETGSHLAKPQKVSSFLR